jgi:hypothetical protein
MVAVLEVPDLDGCAPVGPACPDLGAGKLFVQDSIVTLDFAGSSDLSVVDGGGGVRRAGV